MTPKAFEYRVVRTSCGFQNCMSDILDIRHFAKGQFFSCGSTIPITVDHS